MVKVAEHEKEDWSAELVAIVSSFPARITGQRRAKRQTARMVQQLQGETKHEAR